MSHMGAFFLHRRGEKMKDKLLFRAFTKFDWGLWLSSMALVTFSFGIGAKRDYLTLIASLVGVTALIFVAKGEVFGQILVTLFSVIYGIIAYHFHYYGEMITYVGMTMPIALLSIVSWLRNPYEGGKGEIKVENLSKKGWLYITLLTVMVTFIFYFILKYFQTANLIVSTFSIATSFMASLLMYLRSPYYAIAYAGNDIILIVLWVLATFENSSYFPMIICFTIFLINDIYGFFSWQKMKEKQCID